MALDLLGLCVAHGVLEAREADPKAVEAVVGAVDGEDGGARVGLGHAPVALQHDDLGPDLVVDRLPFVQHLLDVVLQWNDDSEVSFMVLNNEGNYETFISSRSENRFRPSKSLGVSLR